MIQYCKCGKEIEVPRQELNLENCFNCAQNVPKKKGAMIWGHKTAPELQVLSVESHNNYKKYNPYGKNTGRGSGTHRMMNSSNR